MVSAALSRGAAAFAGWTGEQPAVEVDAFAVRCRGWSGWEATVRVAPEAWAAAAGAWNARAAALGADRTAAPLPGLALLLGAATAFGLAVGARASRDDGRPVAVALSPAALVRLAWTAVGPPAGGEERPWEERSFRRCRDGGVVSLALPDATERRMAERALGAPLRDDRALAGAAGAIAAELQAWGLMCLPAREHAAPPVSPTPAESAAALAHRPLLARDGGDGRPERGDGAALLALGTPLASESVVTLGSLVAGPFAGALLAAAGATVRHVAHPARPPLELSAPRVAIEMVDVATDSGRRRLLALLGDATGMVENFRPRVLGNLGLRPLPLARPVRHVALPGFPARSARANWRSVGFQLEAYAGVGVLPLADGPATVRVAPVPLVSDFASALLGAAALTALPAGAHVELAQSRTLRGAVAHRRRAASEAALP